MNKEELSHWKFSTDLTRPNGGFTDWLKVMVVFVDLKSWGDWASYVVVVVEMVVGSSDCSTTAGAGGGAGTYFPPRASARC